jgi:hypothetical protein
LLDGFLYRADLGNLIEVTALLFGVAQVRIAVITAPPLRQVERDRPDDRLQSLRVRL